MRSGLQKTNGEEGSGAGKNEGFVGICEEGGERYDLSGFGIGKDSSLRQVDLGYVNSLLFLGKYLGHPLLGLLQVPHLPPFASG